MQRLDLPVGYRSSRYLGSHVLLRSWFGRMRVRPEQRNALCNSLYDTLAFTVLFCACLSGGDVSLLVHFVVNTCSCCFLAILQKAGRKRRKVPPATNRKKPYSSFEEAQSKVGTILTRLSYHQFLWCVKCQRLVTTHLDVLSKE